MRTRLIAVLLLSLAGLAIGAGMDDFDRVRRGLARLSGEAPQACVFKTRYGVPCLGCGGTHGFHDAVRGRLGTAFLEHPAGAMLGLLAWGTVLAGGVSLLTGRAVYLVGVLLAGFTLVALAFVIHAILWWRALPPGILTG